MSTPTESGHVQALALRRTPKRIEFLAATLLLVACYLAPRAAAIGVYTLAPGANIPAAASSYPTGSPLLLGQVNAPFASGTLMGTLVSSVYSGDTANPYGGYTFTYLLELNSSSTDSSSEFTVGGYSGFQTDVSYNQTGNEIAPSNFLRSGNGAVIHTQWDTSTELPPGDTGALVVIQTGAHAFANNSGSVIDSTATTVPILAPTVVPEPGTVSLVAIGLGALFTFRRRGLK